MLKDQDDATADVKRYTSLMILNSISMESGSNEKNPWLEAGRMSEFPLRRIRNGSERAYAHELSKYWVVWSTHQYSSPFSTLWLRTDD